MRCGRGRMRIYARETGNQGVAANFVLELGAMGVPGYYFANDFEKRDFSLKWRLICHPAVGRHLCLLWEDLVHVQVDAKQSLDPDRFGPNADHDVLRISTQQ